MTVFYITYGTDPSDRPAAYSFATRREAVMATGSAGAHLYAGVPAGSHVGGHAFVVETDEDVAAIHNGLLLAVFNGLTGSGVKKFESRAAGVKRLLSALPQVAKPATIKEENQVMSDEATTTDDKKAARKLKRETQKSEKARAAAEVKAGRKVKLGAFAQVRESSALGVMAKLINAGNATLASLGAAIGKDADAALGLLKRARATHGFDHVVDDDDVVTLVLPEGKSEADLIKVPKVKPEKPASTGERKPQERIQKMFDDARSGIAPEKPIVTSQTNLHRQKHFDALAAHADAGAWDKVESYPPLGVDTYSKMIRRYRDLLLTAHAAQETARAAE